GTVAVGVGDLGSPPVHHLTKIRFHIIYSLPVAETLLISRGSEYMIPPFPKRFRLYAIVTSKQTGLHNLKYINLFDVYESDSLGAGKKSYAVSFMLRDDLRTLTDKNIEKTMNNLLKAFERELNAQIR
ncbi:MAG: hypothetical protein MUD02_10720, partial [Bacteroidales bacterium]|nr:hypothetical protein [Bacteroidales bacterium]